MTPRHLLNESQGTDRRLPLHVQVKDDLIRRVRMNEWNSTTPLPPEGALAEHYGISIGTLRRVLSDLAAEGLLERQQGRGTYVRRASFQNAMYRFFRMQGDRSDTPASRILDRSTVKATAAISSALSIEAGSDVLRIDRLRLWGDTPFLTETIWVPLPQFQSIAEIDVHDLGDLLYPAYERLVGVVIGSAIEELSVTRATTTQAQLLGCSPEEPLVKITRTALSHSGDPVEFRESYGLATSFNYRAEIN